MTDLLTRLRGPAPSVLAMRDAADEIEHLQQRVESLEEHNNNLNLSSVDDELVIHQQLKRIKTLEEVLKDCQTVAIVHGDKYLCDCIDNTGQRYQSAHLAELLEES